MAILKSERRYAPRLSVNIPTLIECIPARDIDLHPRLAAVYERVAPAPGMEGQKFPGVLRDLSSNGAFLSGPALPLLSRVAFTFPLEGYGQVEVLGWTLWRRRGDCEIPVEGGVPARLSAGFGVLFEAIPLAARQFIANAVSA